MTSQRCNMIISANIPNIHSFVVTSHDHISVAPLIVADLRFSMVCHILRIREELKAEDLGAGEQLLLLLLAEAALSELPVAASLGDLGVVNDHFKLRIYRAGEHGVGVGAFFLGNLPYRDLSIVAAAHEELGVLVKGAEDAGNRVFVSVDLVAPQCD